MRQLLAEYTSAVKGLGDRMMARGQHPAARDARRCRGARLFYYPPQQERALSDGETSAKVARREVQGERWGIGPHSDYGLWTMILTDAPGLEFRHPQHGWTHVPLVEGAFVMNCGDVLDRLTGGLYK
eukprot:5299189-Prymnesium_polylepis.2